MVPCVEVTNVSVQVKGYASHVKGWVYVKSDAGLPLQVDGFIYFSTAQSPPLVCVSVPLFYFSHVHLNPPLPCLPLPGPGGHVTIILYMDTIMVKLTIENNYFKNKNRYAYARLSADFPGVNLEFEGKLVMGKNLGDEAFCDIYKDAASHGYDCTGKLPRYRYHC